MRMPAVADRFYPGNKKELVQTVEKLLPRVVSQQKATAVVCPHAGYIFSGDLAAKTLARVMVPRTVVLLGPNHHGLGAPVSLSGSTWKMTQGEVPINKPLSYLLQRNCPLIKVDESSHINEHSLEVQLPFLQKLQEQLSIVPLVFSRLDFDDCEQVASGLQQSIKESGENVLLLASTDMSHYESRKKSSMKDQLALDQMRQYNPKGLYDTVVSHRISMCGFIPVVIALLAAKELGAKQVEIVGYTDSGDVTGDTNQVVGYAGAIIR